MNYIPIAGTGARRRHGRPNWLELGSEFETYMNARGLKRIGDGIRFWSSALGSRFMRGSEYLVWQFGGEQVDKYLHSIEYEDRNLIAHSWGGVVVAFAAAGLRDIKIRRLVTVTTPPRRDLDEVWEAAEKNIDSHLHLYAKGWGDRIGFIARRGRFKRQIESADENTRIDGGHSGILYKVKHFSQIDNTIIPWIRDG